MVKPLADWTPFQRATINPLTNAFEREARIRYTMSVFPTLSRADIEEQFDAVADDVIFLNSRYQVNCRKIQIMTGADPVGPIIHLSIKRIDKERVGVVRYRDFQRIKNELVGPEFEAVEIYPAHSDEIDTANQYHLWVFVGGYKLPFGWHGARAVVGTSPLGGKQHPL